MDLTHRPDETADFLLPVVALLLGNPPQGWQETLQGALERWGWDRFSKVLWENRITLRAGYALREILSSAQVSALPRGALEDLIGTDEARQKRHIQYMRLLSEEVNLDFIFIKTVDNFPDFGHDVDFLTREPGDRVRETFLRGGFVYEEQKLAERIADKMSFTLGDSCPAEAHCARIGEFGEHEELTSYILENKVRVRLNGLVVWGPNRISQILLIVLQRLYRHFNLRGCDVLNAIQWVRAGQVDFPELYRVADRFGVLPGVRWFLRFLNEVSTLYGGEKVVPSEPVSEVLYCERQLFRFSRARFIPAMYGRKVAWSVRRMKMAAVGRELLVVPLAVMAVISHKVLKKDAIW